MTREELSELRESSKNDDQVVEILFDKLNDIESRVCGNCKHYNMDTAVYYCDTYDIVMINSDHTIKTVDEYFGCNKFEVESK